MTIQISTQSKGRLTFRRKNVYFLFSKTIIDALLTFQNVNFDSNSYN